MGPSQPYRLLLDVLRPAVWTVDSAGVVTDASPGTEELTGWPRAGAVGRPWSEVASDLQLACCDTFPFTLPPAAWTPVYREEAELTTHSGAVRYVGVTLHHLKGNTEHGARVLMEDLTAGRRAEASLSQSETRYAALFETLAAGVIVVDMHGRIVDLNATTGQIFGVARDELLGRPISDLVTWESLRALPPFAGPGLPEEGVALELECRRRGGTTFPVEAHLRVVTLGDERLVVAHVRDITEIRATQHELEQSQRFSQRILDATPHLVYIHDLNAQQTLYASPGALRQLGYSAEQIAGFGPLILDILTHPDDRDRCATHHTRCTQLADGEVVESTYRLQAADGQWRAFLSRDTAFERAPDGAVSLVLGTAEDVTDQLRAQASLRESNETAWALLNATHDIAALVDTDGNILGINEALARLLQKPVAELVGTQLGEWLGSHFLRLFQDRLQQTIAAAEPQRHEDDIRGRMYSNVWYPVIGSDGRVTRVAVFIHDVTESRREEAQQRLATVGHLAAGLAHEFNNILMSLMLAAETAASHHDADEYQRLTELVLRSSRRGADICKNLMAFARPRQPKRQPLRVEESIEGALALAARQLEAAGVTVAREYGAPATRVLGDPAQIEQVFLNLIINACHAMPEGGRLTIHTAYEPLASGAGTLRIEVADTGTGIPTEHLGRIFEPFFTTKGRLGQSDLPGTGLGLSVSHGIVTSHGGEITASSRAGAGSTFTLRFPAEAGTQPAPLAVTDPPLASPPPGLRVLLAEDEDDVRQVLAAMLASGGYQVTDVSTPTAAIVRLQEQRFDLVVTDLLMPEGGGRALLDWLRQQPDPPPVLVASGHEDPYLPAEAVAPLRVVTLAKPFLRDALLAAIGELLPH
jgi:PAS domain S-box-containing protein